MQHGLTYLKIKSKTLAAEAKFIRQQERKESMFLSILSYKSDKERPSLAQVMSNVENSLRNRGIDDSKLLSRLLKKATAAWNRNETIARQSMRFKGKNDINVYVHNAEHKRQSLYQHRKDIVRPEARATLIAIAYLKGRPYESVENTFDILNFSGYGITPSDGYQTLWEKVFNIVKKYGNDKGSKEEIQAKVIAWRDSHPQGEVDVKTS